MCVEPKGSRTSHKARPKFASKKIKCLWRTISADVETRKLCFYWSSFCYVLN